MDVTKSQMFFARGILFVEGISEMLEERLGAANIQSAKEESDSLELREIAEMLDNLDAFQ